MVWHPLIETLVTQHSELRTFPRVGVHQGSLSADSISTLTSQTTSTKFKEHAVQTNATPDEKEQIWHCP
jgi:hypothetical protein